MRTKNTPSEKKIIDAVSKRLLGQIQPMLEKKQSKVPQTFMVPVGFNTMMADANRRQTYGTSTTYQTLRQLSQQHETTRAAINLRKRQITQLDWDIVPIDSDSEYDDKQRKKIKLAISQIGGPGVRFRNLIDKFIEDTLVMDAFCFYKQKTTNNQLLRIIPIDPSTIKLRVDEAGMRPMPPEPAFEQWIRGQKVADLTTDDIVYESMNPRSNSPYGLSPIEAMIVTLDASMRAMLYNLAYLSDNNIPNGFLQMPEEWTPEQIKEYKEYLDSVISSPKDQAKVFPIPAGSNYTATTKPSDFSFKDFFDYLDRRVCMLFDIAPQELGMTGQQYKENASSQEEISMRKGLKPLANFIEDIFTEILQVDIGYTDLKFKFNGLETKFKYDDAQKLIPLGVISIDELRNDMGLKKLGVNNLIMQGGMVMPVEQVYNQVTVSGTETPTEKPPELEVKVEEKPSDEAIKGELKAWMNKAINDIKNKGEVYRKFESNIIPKETHEFISKKLENVKSVDEVRSIFKGKKNPIDVILSSKKAKEMEEKVRIALRNQMKPFMQAETIAAFTDESTKMQKAADIDDYFDEIDIDGLSDFLYYGAEEGVKNAKSSGIKGTYQMTNDKYKKWLLDRENYIIESVDNTTKDWIANMIKEGRENEMGDREIANLISEQYEDIAVNRAQLIVRTELANALVTGEIESYKENGIEKKMWVTNVDELTDSDCAELDGKVVDVNDDFMDGVFAPPLHPNCRCYVNPA